MSDALTLHQTMPAAYLASFEYYSNASAGSAARPIRVVTEDLGTIQQAIDDALNLLGITVFISCPGGEAKGDDGPVSLIPRVVVTIIENVLINRSELGTGQTVTRVAADVAARLHQNDELVASDGTKVWLTLEEIVLNPGYADGIAARDVVFKIDSPIRLEKQDRNVAAATFSFDSMSVAFGSDVHF